MTILNTLCRTEAEFFDRYLGDLAGGGLFIPTRMALPLGEQVVVSVRIGPRADPVLLRGSVAWRRPGKHSTKTKTEQNNENHTTKKQDQNNQQTHTHKNATVPARRHQRLPIDLPMHWHIP